MPLDLVQQLRRLNAGFRTVAATPEAAERLYLAASALTNAATEDLEVRQPVDPTRLARCGAQKHAEAASQTDTPLHAQDTWLI